MYGFQSYPTNPKDLRFDLFKYFKLKKFKYGYADHSIHGISKRSFTNNVSGYQIGVLIYRKTYMQRYFKNLMIIFQPWNPLT